MEIETYQTEFLFKHIMFLRPISLELVKKAISSGKFNIKVLVDKTKIICGEQQIFFRFDHNYDQIIGLESKIINLQDNDWFYGIAEFIGKFQINTYCLSTH